MLNSRDNDGLQFQVGFKPMETEILVARHNPDLNRVTFG